MGAEQDFERAWQAKFADALAKIAGQEIAEKVMVGCEELSSDSSPRDVIDWSRSAMDRLDALVDEEPRQQVMLACACQYPKSNLKKIRDTFQEAGSVAQAHQMLQEQFESFLRDPMGLPEGQIAEIRGRGWGLAGILKGNTVIATKIPKSGHLIAYLQETDAEKKRQQYCHCPRVRDALKTAGRIPSTYCYCGAGFYKGIWEEILQRPVRIAVLETVLKGDEVCRFAITLPSR